MGSQPLLVCFLTVCFDQGSCTSADPVHTAKVEFVEMQIIGPGVGAMAEDALVVCRLPRDLKASVS